MYCIGDCTPTCDRGQSEVKRSRRNVEACQAVKLGIGGSLRMVKVSRRSMGVVSHIYHVVKGSSMKI